MGKVGEKQKRRPKIKDKRQSERFRQAARELGVDRITDTFDGVLEMASISGGGSFCTQNGFYQNYLPRRARRR
jgi:hypothetical protein